MPKPRVFFATTSLGLIILGQMALAQQNPSSASNKSEGSNPQRRPEAARTETEQEKPPSKAGQKAENTPSGPREGITVHGDWTIVVRNQDGSLVSRHQFRNSLADAKDLVWVFGRTSTVLAWEINILDALCNTKCRAVENTAWTGSLPGVFFGLTVTVPTSGPNANKLVLAGSVTVSSSGQITKVATVMHNYLPPPYRAGTFSDTVPQITVASPTPINVQAGQQVNLTVALDFT